MTGDLTWLDATDLAALVRAGTASPDELVAAAIDRIERANPAINAVIHPRFDRARAEAAGPLPDGPFRGVPMVVKDLGLATAGDPYHKGVRGLKNAGFTATDDSHLARRFRRAGFVVVGRTNTPELGTTITTEPEAYGPSRNPWNTDHSTGGSSGGSAAAVAAGMVPVGHANDGGGSIRIPASECGLVGLKPSRGRVSLGPETGDSWMGAVVDGCLTRSVRDTAAVLDVISGWETGDPYAAPAPARPYLAEVGAPVERLTVGLAPAPLLPGGLEHPECRAAVERAGALLESLGHSVSVAQPAALTEAEFSDHFLVVVAASVAADLDDLERIIGRTFAADEVEVGNQLLRAIGAGITAPAYLNTERWLQAWSRRVQSWWDPSGGAGFDVLVTPTLASPPPRIGWLTGPDGGDNLRAIMQYTAEFNITGQPAVSLPLHQSADGLPVGVQFVARYGREDVLVRLAAQLEQAAPWAGRRPPVHA